MKKIINIISVLALATLGYAQIINTHNPEIPTANFTANNSPLLNGLVHYWNLNETTGTRSDSLGAAPLTDNNTVGFTTGKNGNAATFVSANLESLSDTTINPGDTDFSFSLWIRETSLGTYVLVARDGSGSRTFLLDVETNKPTFYNLPASNSVVSTVTLSTATWYHVYAYHDSVNNQIGISVNNETIVTTATTGAPGSTPGIPFRVGARDTPGSELYFNGDIDELGMWSRTLSTTERNTLYNSGTGKFYPLFALLDLFFRPQYAESFKMNPIYMRIYGNALSCCN